MGAILEQAVADSSDLAHKAVPAESSMSALFATTNTKAALAHDAVPKCKRQIFS